MKTALVRGYTNHLGKFKYYHQGKVFPLNEKDVYYRDVKKWKARMFRDDTWNMDHMTYKWLKGKVKTVYYYWKDKKTMYKTTMRKIDNAIGNGVAHFEKLNNHTQLFIPIDLFVQDPNETNKVLALAKPHITQEWNVATDESHNQKPQQTTEGLKSLASAWKQAKEKYNI